MENTIKIKDCVEFKNELHKKLYIKSGAKDFNEYIKYINSNYSYNKKSSENNKTHQLSVKEDC
jgi:hypothetical protein